eukprot:283824_1
MVSIEWLRTIPQNKIDCVFGYIHESQRLLPSDAPYYNIPELVAYICLDYYFARETLLYDPIAKYVCNVGHKLMMKLQTHLSNEACIICGHKNNYTQKKK